MDTYLEVEVHDELCKRLFLSFVKRAPTKTASNVDGKVIKVMFTLCAFKHVAPVYFGARGVASSCPRRVHAARLVTA